MAKTGTKTRRGPSAKEKMGTKGAVQSKRSGGGGRPGEYGRTSGEKAKGIQRGGVAPDQRGRAGRD